MRRFALQFPPELIEELAGRFGYEGDAGCLAAGAAARARGQYTRGEFIEVCRWRTPRSGPKVAANSAAEITKATRRALATGDEAVRMHSLIELTGVGVPTASTLLFFAFPDDYPILDVRALESLGVSMLTGRYSVKFWLAYLDACRELALLHGVPIRTLDKALWQYSKERSRQIPARESRYDWDRARCCPREWLTWGGVERGRAYPVTFACALWGGIVACPEIRRRPPVAGASHPGSGHPAGRRRRARRRRGCRSRRSRAIGPRPGPPLSPRVRPKRRVGGARDRGPPPDRRRARGRARARHLARPGPCGRAREPLGAHARRPGVYLR